MQSEMLMLDPPISCTVEVRRNLSAEWYKEIPGIAIEGILNSTFVSNKLL